MAISLFTSPAFAVAQTAEYQAKYHLYRVLDVGKRGVPALSSAQLQWLNRIERTPYFKGRLKTLWFTTEKPHGRNSPPLIVFDGHSTDIFVVAVRAMARWYWIIGDSCSVSFSPGIGEFATPFDDPTCKSGKARML